jgi:hypothetical protein
MQSVSDKILNLCKEKWIVGCSLSELDSECLLGNEVFLSGVAERISAMESQYWEFGSRLMLKKLFYCNAAFSVK